MRIVDANVLIYAVNSSAEHHDDSRRWLDHALGGADSVGLAWIVLTVFLRLTTKLGLVASPLAVPDAVAQVDAWLQAPGARVVQPTPAHATVLGGLLTEIGTGGNLVTDAHLAALSIEHRADVVSYDTDFARFPGVRVRTPGDLLR